MSCCDPQPFCSRSFCNQLQNLVYILFPEGNSIIIDHETRHAHYIVSFLQILKMANVIDLGFYMRVLCGDALSCYHQVGTHGTGQGDKDFHVHRNGDSTDLPLCIFTDGLSGTCGIVQAAVAGSRSWDRHLWSVSGSGGTLWCGGIRAPVYQPNYKSDRRWRS